MKIINYLFIYLIKVYKLLISPMVGQNCRYYPSCSSYCLKCFQKHTTFYALFLSVKRIIKCNPWGGSGHDPVP
ncbi:MAG: membrane protein insertion efficiency factor YidD [Flavobacteriales bacterium TMED191]|nr:MAG: membrane protein insertion efficiency factor YidD [Flavobacteriales bacterium TMED191]|tara:strand:+ start:2054 stop:2272 length:219 start_codon:yes stop_codon:yes gene_type:complete